MVAMFILEFGRFTVACVAWLEVGTVENVHVMVVYMYFSEKKECFLLRLRLLLYGTSKSASSNKQRTE